MGRIDSHSSLSMHGRVRVATWNPYSWERPVNTVNGENIICASGLSLLATAIIWSSIEDQNVNMGQPFQLTYAAPIYGALGTGTGTPADTDTALYAEAGRAVVTAAGTTAASHGVPANISWLFLFPTPSAAVTITEVGVFFQATASVGGSYGGGGTYVSGGGSLFDHSVLANSITQATTEMLTLSVTVTIGN